MSKNIEMNIGMLIFITKIIVLLMKIYQLYIKYEN